MAVSYSLVNGTEFATEASRILEEAWEPPTLRYTPGFLHWQLSFPSAVELPGVAAFEGTDPVGFAAATARRLRCGSAVFDMAIVSFVAVRPAWRGQGIASGLYRVLLEALANVGVPVVTFGAAGSGGEKTLLRAYPEAGFQMKALGGYDSFAFLSRPGMVNEDWAASFSEDVRTISPLAAGLALRDQAALWNSPESAQVAHYFRDPRPRKLVVVEHATDGSRGAAFVVQSELRTAQGIAHATTLDSVWLPGEDADGLRALLQLASSAWPSSSGSNTVVMCPNLGGFSTAVLKAVGVRKTGAQFSGYSCWRGESAGMAAEWTNLEIV